MRRALLAAAGALLSAWVSAQTAAPEPAATPVPKVPAAKAKPKSKGPPLDFTGIWAIDVEASRGVNSQMKDAVLSVRQNGDRIWIEPVKVTDRKGRIVADEIVVDGRAYEKSLGGGKKGTLEAAWATDGKALWLQVVLPSGEGEEAPFAAAQRTMWTLKDGGKTWIRQTRTIEGDGKRDTYLVFRKQASAKAPKPTPKTP